MEEGKQYVEQWYATHRGSETYVDVRMYQDYRELLEQSDIDAVVISTPDHQHFLPTLQAAVAGKDVYLQKPLSLTVEEGWILRDNLQQLGTVFQVGSQQRSVQPWPHFKRACELVRNGRIGQLHTVRVGLPGDPPGGDPTPMAVPDFLDYDMWLGTTPEVPFAVDRVHPLDRIPPEDVLEEGYSRPGWLRCEQFSAGMITGWGAHHVDTAHWGMGTELTGPVEVEATAEFPTEGLWSVHGAFNVEARYANGVTMLISGDFPNGVRFEGGDGWIFVTRSGEPVTGSDPDSGEREDPIKASDPALLESEIGADEIHLYESDEQHTNWVQCIRSRETTVAPIDVAHRSTSACLVAHIAMKLGRKLYWDPEKERFKDDVEANAMLSRPQRHPYTMHSVQGLPVV
jgi:predicted dehydrogenase